MFLVGFLAAASIIIAGLGSAVQFRNYRKSLGLWILAASVFAIAHLWLGYAILHSFQKDAFQVLWRFFFSVDSLFSLGLCHIAAGFYPAQAGKSGEPYAEPRFLAWARMLTLLGIIFAFLPKTLVFTDDGIALAVPTLRGLGQWIPVAMTVNATYALYLLENKYRFAYPYQRRIGRLAFIGIVFLSTFHLLQFGRALLYDGTHIHYPEASSVIYAVVFPVVLGGFFRYRLGSEKISMPRGTLYSSFTVLLVGAVFLGIAATVAALQAFGIGFGYYEVFLGVFSFTFLSLLVLGSGTMRRRIVGFLNSQIYSQKYDYKEQFFQLHRTLHSGFSVSVSVTELIENMKYSVSVSDAHCFLRDPGDGQYREQRNKEESSRPRLVLSGDSELAECLAVTGSGIDLLSPGSKETSPGRLLRNNSINKTLNADAAFPIKAGEQLVGVLFLKGGRKQYFDSEDLALIDAFTRSIGDVVYQDQVRRERMQQKQFESFNHIASFIVHDIKNQVATLNLLLKNAQGNIANPSFQESMLRAVGSSAKGLQALVDRLSVAPHGEGLRIDSLPLYPVIETVIGESGLPETREFEYHLAGDKDAKGFFDPKALYFVVKNLVQNALDATGGRGRLHLECGLLKSPALSDLQGRFGGNARFYGKYGVYLTVRDNGPGMDNEFLKQRLFQPFATTKEKGVGIGLYQAKSLVEKMAGNILCHSVVGQGTEFCILLPGESRTPLPSGDPKAP